MDTFPSDPDTLVQDDKVYIKNLEVMLAHDLIEKKTGRMTVISKKYLSDNHIPNQPPVGWYMSEKYDGIRFIYPGPLELTINGIDTPMTLFTRASPGKYAKQFNFVPQEFFVCFGTVPMDGEIWAGEGNFGKVAGISSLKLQNGKKKVTPKDILKHWIDIGVKIAIFDIPTEDPSIPFEDRLAILEDELSKMRRRWARVQFPEGVQKPEFPFFLVTQTRCRSEDHLMEYYTRIIRNGGEGVILRAPQSRYFMKRTKALLKFKSFNDAEGIITGYLPGTGKLDRQANGHFVLGSLVCNLLDKQGREGVELRIGTGFTDEQRENYLNPESEWYMPIGTIVNFSFMEFTDAGIPRHPAFRGIRADFHHRKKKSSEQKHTDDDRKGGDRISKEQIISAFNGLIILAKTKKEKNFQFKIKQFKKVIDVFTGTESERFNDIHEIINILRTEGEMKLADEETFFERNKIYKSSILNSIEEILRTGTLQELVDSNLDSESNKVNVIKQLTGIWGIGDVKAEHLYAEGIRSVDQLREHTHLLTEAQIIGLEYYNDFMKRIPRTEMNKWNKLFQKIASELNGHLIISGSYRRNAKDSGDIDVLIKDLSQDKTGLIFHNFINILKSDGILIADLAYGDHKYMGACRLTNDSVVRRVDIYNFTEDVYPFALLHSTGSGEFNKNLRAFALTQGYSLSEYGITPAPKDYDFNTEEDIFHFFGLEYIEPKDRTESVRF